MALTGKQTFFARVQEYGRIYERAARARAAIETRFVTGEATESDLADAQAAVDAALRAYRAYATAPIPPERNEIDALYAAADDYESATLDSLRERAGLIWRCTAPLVPGSPCNWRNHGDVAHCESCGAARPTTTRRVA